MEEEVQLYIGAAEERMHKSVDHLEAELVKIRAGKANSAILNDVKVDYYGVETPLNQASNVSTPDSKTIAIQPWDKGMIDNIERAILASNIGLTPMNNGDVIRLNLPPLTEERRKSLVKQVKTEGENTKVSIRNFRKEANDDIKKLQKDGLAEDLAKDAEEEIQQLTNKYSEKVDVLVEKKEEDIMTI